MEFIRNEIGKRNLFVILSITLLFLLTAITYALTYSQLYGALDTFLNGKGVWDTVAGQIKTLEDQVTELQEQLDEENEAERKVNVIVLRRIDIVNMYTKALKSANERLKAAVTARQNAEADEVSAKNAYVQSISDEYIAYNLWRQHTYYSDCYACSGHYKCSIADNLLNNWRISREQLVQAKKDYAAAKKIVKERKAEESSARKTVTYYQERKNWWEIELRLAENELDRIAGKIDTLQTRFDEKDKELQERIERRDTLRRERPNVKTYMDNIRTARKSVDFDFDEYIESNPPPEIIFAEE